jgi:prepilin-type N-terminal cleavage/methylation domain-containing protein
MLNLNNKKGFTLIELLVVIAIIGILSSVVLASLSTARAKSRDARRIGDISQMRTALEVYFDAYSTYATSSALQTWNVNSPNGGIASTSPVAIPKIPVTPSIGYNYYYCAMLTASSTTCDGTGILANAYALGADIERNDNQALKTDGDKVVGASFYGGGSTCTTNSGQDSCFDITN